MKDKRPGINSTNIINQIIIRPVIRTKTDVANWRNFHRAAEWSPWQIRQMLYDLYDDCLLDPVLSDQVDQLHMAVTSPKLQFLKDGKEVPEVQALIDTPEMEDLLRELVNTILWGYTVEEFDFNTPSGVRGGTGSPSGAGGLASFTATNIPRKHIRPLLGIIAQEQTGITGINYREAPYNNYVFECGKPRDLGLLLKAVPYVLFKRGGFNDWSQFSEIFGMPTRVAKYDASNASARHEAQRALEEAGAALSIVVPKEVEFDLKGTVSNMDGMIYRNLLAECDKQLMILMTGNTETGQSTRGSSGLAQAKVHQQTKDTKKEYVRRYVMRIMNSPRFKQIWQLNGLPMEGGVWQLQKDEEDIQLPDKMTVWVQAKQQLGTPIADEDIYEEFGIPMPDNYDELKTQMQEQQKLQQQNQNNQNGNDDDEENEGKQNLTFGKLLRRFFD